jgi:hypothetical protein
MQARKKNYIRENAITKKKEEEKLTKYKLFTSQSEHFYYILLKEILKKIIFLSLSLSLVLL